jgi:uncharacterized protein YecE (DUF72 family)
VGARVVIGQAGWSVSALPPELAAETEGRLARKPSHLERYARLLRGVEINSSFYRPHQPKTYEKWAAAVPESFRFAVKMPKTVTHEHRLEGAEEEVARFLFEAGHLGAKLGPLLVQLPPSLTFDAGAAGAFFADLRRRFGGAVALEPRHASWFTRDAEWLVRSFGVARVAADPVPKGCEGGAEAAGDATLRYVRLHGSPKIYYSAYDEDRLSGYRRLLRELAEDAVTREVWCIFDNTAAGFALRNALETADALGVGGASVDLFLSERGTGSSRRGRSPRTEGSPRSRSTVGPRPSSRAPGVASR